MNIETIAISSGLSVTLLDQTRHYFGGYFHVKVLAYCDIPLKPGYFGNNADYFQAVEKMGSSIRFERVLEKMAVPESEINTVRSRLIQACHETTMTYLATSDFAARFVQLEYQNLINKSPQTRIPRA